jgi:hypothetical protein
MANEPVGLAIADTTSVVTHWVRFWWGGNNPRVAERERDHYFERASAGEVRFFTWCDQERGHSRQWLRPTHLSKSLEDVQCLACLAALVHGDNPQGWK